MRLRLTPRAEADLVDISAYLTSRNPLGAERVEAAIQEALALLARYPEAGYRRRHNVRRFALPRYPYLIFYRFDEAGGTVEVFSVRHAAREEEN